MQKGNGEKRKQTDDSTAKTHEKETPPTKKRRPGDEHDRTGSPPPVGTGATPHGLTINGIQPPPHPPTGHASNIGFKIMEIFADHTKEHRRKNYLYSYVDPETFDSGGTAKEKSPRPHSEIKALYKINTPEGVVNPGTLDTMHGSILQNALDKAITEQKKRAAQGQPTGQLRVKFYIQNSAFPPCFTTGDVPGIPCDTSLKNFVDKLKSRLDARMKVHNPTSTLRILDKQTGKFEQRTVAERTTRYGYTKQPKTKKR